MGYKEKYEMALERARTINSGKYVDIPAEDTVLEYIFPELKESEDEKMLKAITQGIKRITERIMAENKDNNERKAQIAEVNKHIRDGINQWADIMLTADADQWAYDLTYFPRDLMNATLIFQHVASNIGIKAGRINEEKATEYGQRLRQLVIDMTGYDPHDFWKDPKNYYKKDENERVSEA